MLELAINDFKAGYTNVFKDLNEDTLLMIKQIRGFWQRDKNYKKEPNGNHRTEKYKTDHGKFTD